MASLLLKNINKIYPNKVQAVFDFNLEIKDKEFIVFVGPSGCGKSTTLRMVAGLEEISDGELYIDGELMNNVEPMNRNIAMVFQSYALYPHMTVFDNMAFALKMRKSMRPVLNETAESEAKYEEIKAVLKKLRKINRHFKRKQNDLDILPERSDLYKELYRLYDEMIAACEQVNGRDEYGIKVLTKEIKKLVKQKEDLERLLPKLESREDGAELIEKANNLINQKESLISKRQERLDYLMENDVPLFKPRHLKKLEIDIEVNKAADNIDLARYIYRKPSALSGGQRQRVALGRAIVRKPKVFLMDEPLSNLDAKLRVQTRTEILKIHRNVGATTIYVTHDQTEAMTMADRIVIMKDGYVQQIGKPEELYQKPVNKFVAGFIGSPSMNFIKGTYSKGVFTIKPAADGSYISPKEKKTVKIKLDEKYVKLLKGYEGKELYFGFRPEDGRVDNSKGTAKKNEPIDVVCHFAELLGYEYIIHTSIAGHKICFKTPTTNTIERNDDIKLAIDNNKIYFFDVETEKTIY